MKHSETKTKHFKRWLWMPLFAGIIFVCLLRVWCVRVCAFAVVAQARNSKVVSLLFRVVHFGSSLHRGSFPLGVYFGSSLHRGSLPLGFSVFVFLFGFYLELFELLYCNT